MSRPLEALVERMPTWVTPTAFVLLGAWEFADAWRFQSPARFWLGLTWVIIGALHGWRLAHLRRMADAMRAKVAQLEAELLTQVRPN